MLVGVTVVVEVAVEVRLGLVDAVSVPEVVAV